MAFVIQCPKCDHEWEERHARVGKSVDCPECGESVRIPRAGRSGESGQHRPPLKKDGNLGRVLLIGGSIFLIGVLAMVGIRMSQLASDDSDSPAPAVTTPQNGEPNATPSDVPSSTNDPIVVSDSVPADTSDNVPSTEPPADTSTAKYDDSAILSATNTDRGRELMAAMDSVGLRVTGFTSDVRGAVAEAVETGVSAAIEQCKLSVRPPHTEPVMLIELELRDDKLVLSARLIAKDQQQLVKVWERSGTVAELPRQALTKGILPPNLKRDVISFFNSLHSEFNDARRQFASR